MQLNVVLLNSLIKAINHTYDILIIRVEFDMLLLAIRSVSFWVVVGLDLLHTRKRFFCVFVFVFLVLSLLHHSNRFLCFHVLLYYYYTSLLFTLYFFFNLIASLYSFVLIFSLILSISFLVM